MALFINSAVTWKAHEAELRNPALCEELRVRDILDNLIVTTSGAFVAAYELAGIHSQYHEDSTRNRTKESLEAVLRALPERSMRMHVRLEIRQDTGAAIDRYIGSTRTENAVLREIDRERHKQWREKESSGEFLDFRLHVMLHWDSQVQHTPQGKQWEQKLRRNWSLSGQQSIQRAHDEHKKLAGVY